MRLCLRLLSVLHNPNYTANALKTKAPSTIKITFGTLAKSAIMSVMAYWFHIGLLVLNEDQTKFLVCEKEASDITNQYIMPGGQMEEETLQENLQHEIKEELDCEVDFDSLEYIGEFADEAAGDPEHEVAIELYRGKLKGEPKPSHEIKRLHWIGKEDANNPRVSPIIRNKIIPSLVEKGILK